MNTTEPRIGHGVDPHHCRCHGDAFVVPSLAADCEDRTERATPAGVDVEASPS